MKPIEILLVEDNPGDVTLTREVFKEASISNNIHNIQDGEDAICYLRKEGKYANTVTPDIIILDLNLPKKDGREVLREIKTDMNLKRIPVIVFTSSTHEVDIVGSYDNHASCYIRKPITLNHYNEVLQEIIDFWLVVVQLPTKEIE